jgi:queuosine precursor transporter
VKKQKAQYKCIIFIAVLYFTAWAATYPMVYKMVSLAHVLETGAIFLFPLSYALADVITEVYGYQVARQVVWTALICGFLYTSALEVVTYMPPAKFWHHEGAYQVVFGHMLRAYFSLAIATIIGAFVNIYIISKWKIFLKGRYFWLRSLGSTAIGELLFTIIGGALSYSGIEPFHQMFWLMFDGYMFKMIYAFIAVWPIALLAIMLKRIEKVDVFDNNINYNPFKLGVD